eukprot:SAG11_NODE_11360_length_766_cov_0.983508_1_plen_49_part_10
MASDLRVSGSIAVSELRPTARARGSVGACYSSLSSLSSLALLALLALLA